MSWQIIKKIKNRKCVARCSCCNQLYIRYLQNILRWKSRGCFKCRRKSNKDERRTYTLIRYRCNTKTSPDYPKWGGAGVECRFKTFEEFFKCVGRKPSKAHSIDRFPKSNGHYEKGNVRWATQKEQGNNRKNNVFIKFKNQRKTASEWSKLFNINYSTLRERLKRGYSVKRALLTPVNVKFSNKETR